MNLNFSLLDEPMKFEHANFFIIEDVNVFAKMIQWLYDYKENGEVKLFNDRHESMKESELMIITDILGFDINSATTLKLIYSDLERQLNEKPEVKSMITKLTDTISELIEYELLDHEMDLESDEITILELFKALGVKIETTSDTIYEKIIEILQVFKYLTKKKLLIFINVCSYLTLKEIEEIRSYISLCNMDVLFIEPRKIAGITQTILDNDYFLVDGCMVE
ncbi:type II-A CRISPR-associated protein Csn2 [Enterococcus mundtii]|uniref:type II-A CRISPR-associated protein Csn2 n=1 Tax=Enterococcus mundtii TaxID=53346 RepID=UPI000E076626|nr:type II-A CRISPR-associated protein Csn2 [Enterococcus mundtii]STD21664.1 CRISPR associated protein [Enterococcus mundtii]